jgi:hypothetical protein
MQIIFSNLPNTNYYVVHVASQNIKISDLHTNFAAIHSGKLFDQCASSDKITIYQKAIDDFLHNYDNLNFQVRYSREYPIIKTESNPSSAVVDLRKLAVQFTAEQQHSVQHRTMLFDVPQMLSAPHSDRLIVSIIQG